ncbi:hypothetical protein L596_013209 [Steinernema carpocapsae]|uniref:Uncharacterized protein n=1 Tax=Steinernema carpocapsae TaxID=34508 RepID=A0A4U5NZF9_STECR|nr:hypothetical protein L596_013209 [Steinernema carpocapsae]
MLILVSNRSILCKFLAKVFNLGLCDSIFCVSRTTLRQPSGSALRRGPLPRSTKRTSLRILWYRFHHFKTSIWKPKPSNRQHFLKHKMIRLEDRQRKFLSLDVSEARLFSTFEDLKGISGRSVRASDRSDAVLTPF